MRNRGVDRLRPGRTLLRTGLTEGGAGTDPAVGFVGDEDRVVPLDHGRAPVTERSSRARASTSGPPRGPRCAASSTTSSRSTAHRRVSSDPRAGTSEACCSRPSARARWIAGRLRRRSRDRTATRAWRTPIGSTPMGSSPRPRRASASSEPKGSDGCRWATARPEAERRCRWERPESCRWRHAARDDRRCTRSVATPRDSTSSWRRRSPASSGSRSRGATSRAGPPSAPCRKGSSTRSSLRPPTWGRAPPRRGSRSACTSGSSPRRRTRTSRGTRPCSTGWARTIR